MDRLAQDLRHALRRLRKSPGFTLVVVLTLALGIGANTAIFSLLDQVLLRPLPVRAPSELVLLDGPGAFHGHTRNQHTFSYPMYRDLRDQPGGSRKVFSGVLAHFPTSANLATGDTAERVDASVVSGNYFDLLGVSAAAGRTLTPADDDVAATPAVVLSHGYWTRRFGADHSVVGRGVAVNGQPFTVIGVAAAGFFGVEVGAAPDLFVPLCFKPRITPTWNDMDNRRSRWLYLMARLAPGVSRTQAEAAANLGYQPALQRDLATMTDAPTGFAERFMARRLLLLPGARGLSELRERFQAPLLVLMAMVCLVLLIACANVANLLIARGNARQRELAIRTALGARRRDLVRQLSIESLLLCGGGGAAGVLLAGWADTLLIQALPFVSAASTLSAAPDSRVLAFTLLVCVLTGLLFGVLPALHLAPPPLAATLKEQAASVVGGSPQALRKALVVAQIALSLLLLFGAGLFARSLDNLRRLDPGFDTDRLIAFAADPSLSGYDQTHVRSLFRRLETELAGLPGVHSVSSVLNPVMTGNDEQRTIRVDGYSPAGGEAMNAETNFIGPAYFETLGMPLLAGREFTPADDAGAPRVAVVNQHFAHRFFGAQNPLGRRVGFGNDSPTAIEIVGVIRDGKTTNLRDEIPIGLYFPYRQMGALDELTFYVRSTQDEARVFPALRAAVARVDPSLPIADLKTMRVQVAESLFNERLTAVLSAGFGLVATFLAALGLYGVIAYSVARRGREIGIRMALGAARWQVLRMVMGEVAFLTALGVAIGLPGAWAGSRLLTSQLFGLSPADPITSAAASSLIALVALLAGYVPARRATRIDPMTALRYE